jgi:hypothetical protein
MKIAWQITRADVASVKELIRQQAGNALVRIRAESNLALTKPKVRRSRFWFQMVSMRLTSLQRSGPNSHVARFIRTSPFPLSYDATCGAKRICPFIARTLKDSGGIRFGPKIAKELAANLRLLEDGEWTRALKECNRLTRRVSRDTEKEVANYIKETFYGFGPKQSRNLLQALGLTRYEIPIDSRVTDWLNEFGFPVKLSAAGLADLNYYNFVSEGVQALCAQCRVFPCILDAAIFALRDGDAWNEKNVIS